MWRTGADMTSYMAHNCDRKPGLQWEMSASVRKTDRAKVVTDNDKWLLPVS